MVIRITLAYWIGGILPYVFKNAFAFPSVLSCSFLRIDRQRRWIFHILPQTVWQDDGVQPALNLMCNLLQDSSASDAIKMLQARQESLVTVLNKPGKPFGNVLVLSNLQVYTIINNMQCCHEPEETSARALPLRVCKQRFCSFDTAVARKAIKLINLIWKMSTVTALRSTDDKF